MPTYLADVIFKLVSSGSKRSGKTANSLFPLTYIGEECHNVTIRAAVLLLLYAE